MNPEHLLEQAGQLIERGTAGGGPRDVDLRRAISAAYYAVFHYLLRAAADEYVGAAARGTSRYTLVYRSIDHRALRSLCREASSKQLSPRYQGVAPTAGFTRDVKSFAGYVLDLQDKRLAADYDPSAGFGLPDALVAIATAEGAIERFARVSPAERQIFLALLLFPPR